MQTEGKKNDQGKLRYDLIPPEALEALASVLTMGANKYNDRNWEQGIKWGRVFGAMMRHAWAWWRRRDIDDESGFSHMWHVFCCAAFLITYEARGMKEFDDRQGANVLRNGDNRVHSVGGSQASNGSGERAGTVQDVLSTTRGVV